MRTLATTLTILLLLAGCRHYSYIDPVYTPPPPPKGPASVSGSLNISAPDLRILRGGPQGAVVAHGRLTLSTQLGLTYPTGAQHEAQIVRVQDYGVQPVFSAPGLWKIPYSFTDVPLDRYTLGLFLSEGGDFEMQYLLQAGPEFELTAAQPSLTDNNWDFSVDSGTGRIYGKLLLDGNGGFPASLGLIGADPGSYATAPQYNVAADENQHGRAFYELANIAAGTHYLQGSFADSGPQILIDDQPAATNAVTLTEAQPEQHVTLHLGLWRTAYDGYSDPNVATLKTGVINLSVKVKGATAWNYDVVAEAVGGGLTSRAFLFPQQLGLGGIAGLRLGMLDPGSYTVTVYKLGEDNNSAAVNLGSVNVDLARPPLQQVEGGAVQPQPQASANLTITLPTVDAPVDESAGWMY